MQLQQKNILLLIAFSFLSFFLFGCFSSEETKRDEKIVVQQNQQKKTSSQKPVKKKIAPPTKQQKNSHGFSVNADTIEVVSGKKTTAKPAVISKKNELTQYYSIQIGGFRDAANALRAEQLLQKRYTNPTHSFYDTNLKLTRVFIGKFATSNDAQALLSKMKKDFPSDYKSAFVWKMEQ